jgi:LysM repeat protein
MFYAYLPTARPVLLVGLAASVLGLVTACGASQTRLEQSASAPDRPGAGYQPPAAIRAAGTAFGSRAVGQVTPPPVLVNPRHPDRYVVQSGDTLWDIASLFLQDPWYWPEIWQINPQVANPHLIFPGDVLSLSYLDGQPVIQLERGTAASGAGVERLSPRVRSEPLEDAIPTIPFETLRAFLSRPTLLERDQIETLPYVFAHREGLVGSAGREVYVRGTDAPEGTVFSLVHVGNELVDPDDNAVIGYEGIYVGEGRVGRSGDPTTLLLTHSARETLIGDYLITEDIQTPVNYFPRAPEGPIDGSIISVIDGISLIGSYQVIVINRGARDGLEPGHVLQAYRAGRVATDDVRRSGLFAEKVRLPDELAGTMMVFRIFDRMSYALVMEASSEIRVLDIVRNPT